MKCWAAAVAVVLGTARGEDFPEGAAPARPYVEACKILGYEELARWCNGSRLPLRCFHMQTPGLLPGSCQLLGPSQGGTSLFGEGTLAGGDLRLSGKLRFIALRLDLHGSLTLEDAEVVMSHNQTSEVERGGAFAANGTVTLRRASLTVQGTTRAREGGGFHAYNLTLLQGSNLSVSGSSASGDGGGFFVDGVVTVQEESALRLRRTSANVDAGGFGSMRGLRLKNGSIDISDSSAGRFGGGFVSMGDLWLQDGSSVWLRRTHAKNAGGFYAEHGLQLKDGASIHIADSSAAGHSGGFFSGGDLWLQDSMLSIQRVSAGTLYGAFSVSKMTLQASNLKVEGAKAVSCGSFMAGETKLLRSNLQIIDSLAQNATDRPALESNQSRQERVLLRPFWGGFLIDGGLTMDASSLHLLHVRARYVGGFEVHRDHRLELKKCTHVTVQHAHAGAVQSGEILIAEGSSLHVSDCSAPAAVAGIATGSMHIIGWSTVHIERVASAWGSGVFSRGDVVLSDGSLLHISNALASGSVEVFGDGGGLYAIGSLQVLSNSAVRIEHTRAAEDAGGFGADGVLVADGSLLLLRNASSAGTGGGFLSHGAVNVINNSNISISGASSGGDGGGFSCHADLLVSGGSVIEISQATSDDQGGGFCVGPGSVQITGGSHVNISNTQAVSFGGGFFVKDSVTVSEGSELLVDNATAGQDGGGFFADGVEVHDQSLLSISGAVAGDSGGGFAARAAGLRARDSSIIITDSAAKWLGGGFFSVGDVLISQSSLHIARCTAARQGGGFNAQATLRVIANSTLDFQSVTAASGGGFGSLGRAEIHDSSVEVSGAAAVGEVGGDGGGWIVSDTLVINGSRLLISNSTARSHGGGFVAFDILLTGSEARIENVAAGGDGAGFNSQATLRIEDGTVVDIQNASARRLGGGFTSLGAHFRRAEVRIAQAVSKSGGCFHSSGMMELSDSLMIASECSARVDGGGMNAKSVSLRRSRLSISGSALERGGGIFAKRKFEAWDSELQVLGLDRATAGPAAALVLGSGAFVAGPLRLSNSALHLQNLQGESAVASRCLLLSKSTVSLDAATKVGIFVGNEACTCGAAAGAASSRAVGSVGSTSFLMDGAVVGSGVSSTLLSLEPCGNETLEIAHLHLKTPAGASVAKTTAPSRLRNVTVEYSQPLDAIQLLAAPSFEAESVHVSCAACAHGVTFASPSVGSGLQVVSPASLHCENATAVLNGTTPRCRCAFSQQVPDKNTYGRDVRVSETGDYCMYCQAHSRARGEGCEKCPPHQAWSEGTGDPCAFLPAEAELWLPLLLGAAVFVFLAAAAFEVIWAPLAVVDAHTLGCEGVIVTVQGPICRLPKFLVHHIHRNVSFRFQRTGLSWLDGPQRIAGKVKRLSRCKLQLPPQPEQPPYDCATSKGFLGVSSGYGPMLLQLWILLFSLLLVPTSLAVAMLSRNDARHVLVTAVLFFVLPLMVCAAALHPVVAWLLQRHRTPLQEACREYLSRLSTGSATILPEDPDHPKNQGMSIQALQHFWEHFKHFLLERNMHFVVANIVKPLTEKRQTSFVGLLLGKPVSYFVSHSWATPFQHFVQCLQRHAAFTGALEPTYWICSFANNQWDIAKEIGTDVLDSAFAKVLHSDVQGVVMVLDQQVQPFTRVWCLFELFLSCEKALEVVFATDSGILGDECCDSVGVALELGRRISGLQVETCHASSEIDKQRIFAHIRSELGSLARMDHKIKDMIRDMLRRNLQHARTSTADLRQQLEQ